MDLFFNYALQTLLFVLHPEGTSFPLSTASLSNLRPRARAAQHGSECGPTRIRELSYNMTTVMRGPFLLGLTSCRSCERALCAAHDSPSSVAQGGGKVGQPRSTAF